MGGVGKDAVAGVGETTTPLLTAYVPDGGEASRNGPISASTDISAARSKGSERKEPWRAS